MTGGVKRDCRELDNRLLLGRGAGTKEIVVNHVHESDRRVASQGVFAARDKLPDASGIGMRSGGDEQGPCRVVPPSSAEGRGEFTSRGTRKRSAAGGLKGRRLHCPTEVSRRGAGNYSGHALASCAWRFATRILART